MKLASCLLFSFLLEMHNAKRISIPKNVKRVPLKKTISSWHIANLDNTKSLHQGILFNEKIATNMAIGKPEQRFAIQFDTGSLGFWVFSKDYTYTDATFAILKDRHKLYNKTASSLYQPPDPDAFPEIFRYSRGWAFGFKANDILTMLDVQFRTPFYEINLANMQAAEDKYDGVLGLRYDPHEGNIIRRLCIEKQRIEINRFAIHYRRIYDTEMDSGVLTVCHIDPKKYNVGTMHWIKESEHGNWTIEIEKARMQDKRGNVTFKAPLKAWIESASPDIMMPEADLNLFYDNLKPYITGDPKTSEFDCEFIREFPDIVLTIDEEEYTIYGFDYTRESSFNGTKYCNLAIQEAETYKSSDWTLGAPFLRKFYTAFDMQTHQVGFAELLRKPRPV